MNQRLSLLNLLACAFLMQLLIGSTSATAGVKYTAPPGTIWENLLPIDAPLDVEWVGDTKYDGVSMKRLRYTSTIWDGSPQRVFALYAHPEGAGPFPTVLQIHGGGQTCFPSNVAFFVKHGYACLSFDWTGRRDNRPLEEITDWPADFAGSYTGPPDKKPGQSLVHHAVIAALRGIDVLCEQPEVEQDRIGVQGISWGGFLTWVVNGLDPRVKAATPTYGVGGLDEAWIGMSRTLIEESPLAREWRVNYDPEAFASTQNGAVLFVNASNDFFGQMPQAEERLSQIKVDKRRTYGANRNHSLDPDSVVAAMRWFDHHLKGEGGFPAEPTVEVEVDESGIPIARITIDESTRIESVQVQYSRGGLPPLIQCWLSANAVRESTGIWLAPVPVVDTAEALRVFAQATYKDWGQISSPVVELVPAIQFPEARDTILTSDVLSDWDNGPSGWFLLRGTDYPGDNPGPILEVKEVGGQVSLGYSDPNGGAGFHMVTRLPMDPARNRGNRKELEIWTHDVEKFTVRTNSFMQQPGNSSFEVDLKAGAGWVKSRISLGQMKEIEGDTLLSNWNGVRQLSILGEKVPEGIPAVGLVRWVDD